MVERSLSMREVRGSIPRISKSTQAHGLESNLGPFEFQPDRSKVGLESAGSIRALYHFFSFSTFMTARSPVKCSSMAAI